MDSVKGIPERLAPAWARLNSHLRGLGSLMVAFSGGVDSSLLLKAAVEALGPERVRAALCVGALTPPWEIAQARRLAKELGLELMELDAGELDEPALAANDEQRCYFCKRLRLGRLRELARELGLAAVAEGSQLDDLKDHRPGSRAVAELGILSPLRQAGLDKTQVRELSAALGLATARHPSGACLATRIPRGVPLTPAALARVAQGEAFLRGLLPGQVRLRDHFPLARLELPPERIGLAASAPLRGQILAGLTQAGYRFVCLDLRGYRPSGLDLLDDPTTATKES